MQLLHDWCLHGVKITVIGLAQQIGQRESSEGNVISESSDCFKRNISIRRRTSSISAAVTCVGSVVREGVVFKNYFNKKKFQREITLTIRERKFNDRRVSAYSFR